MLSNYDNGVRHKIPAYYSVTVSRYTERDGKKAWRVLAQRTRLTQAQALETREVYANEFTNCMITLNPIYL